MEKHRKAIVGLGNPGRKYRKTRHNIGFLVVENLVEVSGGSFAGRGREYVAADVVIAGTRATVLKPQTYMNNSGVAVNTFLRYSPLLPEHLLIIYDDIHLPFGRLRFRSKGSAGGHNGLSSIIAHLGTEEIPRLRVGIGGDFKQGQMVKHVLSKFDKSEKTELCQLLDRATEAIRTFMTAGILEAMNEFN